MAAGETKEAWIQKLCLPAEQKDNLKLYQLKTEVSLKDEEHQIQVLTIGPVNQENFKSVLLLGETGVGKTRVIDAFINHIFDIDFDDPFRLYLKDQLIGDPKKATESQTDYITAYRIYHQDGMRCASNFLFIDTPGFCDTRGEDFQRVSLGRLNAFFLGKFEIDDLHCIGIVVKANKTRSMKHEVDILKEITSMFGDDCSPITRLLCTFACDEIFVADVVRDAGIQFVSQHGFDNYPIYWSCHLKTDFDRNYKPLKWRWDNMNMEYSKFFENLLKSPSVSVKRTRDLHQKKRKLGILEMLLVEAARLLSASKKHLTDKKKIESSLVVEAESVEWEKNISKHKITTHKVDYGYHVHNCKKCCKTCKKCVDPSNAPAGIKAAIVGAYGIVSGALPVALIGAGDGIIGGPIGVAIGAGIGGVFGISVGIYSAYNSWKRNTDCLLLEEDCGADGCNHKPNDHEIVTERLETKIVGEKTIDHALKSYYDELMVKIENMQPDIMQQKEEIENMEQDASKKILDLVNICKDISDLSLGSNSNNPERIIEKMNTTMEDATYFEVIKWFKEEIVKHQQGDHQES